MDNYSLEEVKMLIKNNMITPDIFNNILKSTSRRIELYNDNDDLEILKLLSDSDVVPVNIKKDIIEYLDSYKKNTIKIDKKERKNSIKRRPVIIVILLIAILLIIICFFLIINKV